VWLSVVVVVVVATAVATGSAVAVVVVDVVIAIVVVLFIARHCDRSTTSPCLTRRSSFLHVQLCRCSRRGHHITLSGVDKTLNWCQQSRISQHMRMLCTRVLLKGSAHVHVVYTCVVEEVNERAVEFSLRVV
jgi:hypothetical protein